MKINKYEKNVVDFAYEIINMHQKILKLQDENERLREYEIKYNKLIDDEIKHNDAMMGNMLKACLSMDKDQLNNAFNKKAV